MSTCFPSKGGAGLARPGLLVLVLALMLSVQAAAGASPAEAYDLTGLSIEELLTVEVFSASKFTQKITEAPAAVTIITAADIKQYGHRTLADVLASVRGMYVSNDRNYAYLGVRGFNRPGDYNSRILLLTDGARRNDALYDQAHIGNEAPIELDWVKRLEFVSGPSSAVYGGNALFGIVNAVMLDGGDVNGTRLSAEVGSGASRRLGLLAGQRMDDTRDWLVALAASDTRGSDLYFPEFNTGVDNGWARGLDGESYQKAYAKFNLGHWHLSANLSS